MSTGDDIQPVNEVLASAETDAQAQAQTPPVEPTPTPAAAPASNARQPPIAGSRNPIHNPFPASLASECKKAAQIIESFVDPRYAKLDGTIPQRILAPAKGLVICSVFKAGFLGSVRFGSGLIVCRLPDGGWSAPSAVSLGGLGAGGQFGMEFTNFVFVLNTDAAITTFINSGTLTMGGNISIAFGTGRSAETSAIVGTKGVAGIFAYSKTRGVYGGLTLEGGMIVERSSANKKLYGRKLKAKELLTGEVRPPPQAEPLMHILNSDAFRVASVGEQSSAGDETVRERCASDRRSNDGSRLPEAQATNPSVADQAAETQDAVISAPGLPVTTPVVEELDAGAHNTETGTAEAGTEEAQAEDIQAQETPLAEVTPHQPIEPAAVSAVSEPELQLPRVPNSEH
ncbi:SH3 domain-containing protein [Penicillium herquei]|nr:SH3 domain-containing protein [Penicillium herquei]